MAFVNKTMLHLDHSDLRQLQEQTSWEALPEQAHTLSLAAVFSLLHHFERASERGEKVFFPDTYTPVGVDLGFTMTQRFIAVDDTVLFREAVNKLITVLVNSDYLEVSLSQLHPGNLNYALSEAGASYSPPPRRARPATSRRFCPCRPASTCTTCSASTPSCSHT